MASKVVVVGDVNGQLKNLFSKLATLQAKQNFSFAIVAGNLFVDEEEVADLLAEKFTVPLTTYFTVGTRALPQSVLDKLSKDEDVCPNLYFLGKRSTTKTSDGVKIVTLGGQLDEAIVGLSEEQTLPFHTTGDASSLRGANTADILITTLWPAGVRKGSAKVIAETATEPKSHEHIAELCSVLKPRYHFSASDFFFEREPFFHQPSQDSPDVRPITRFISIARFGNTDKEKAMYAFSLPQSPDLTAPIPQGTTASPFISTRKRPALESEPYSRFAGNQHNGHRDKRRKGRDRYRPPPGPEDCFFCLSNPSIGQHLISSIGEDSYLTMAKGPLTTPTTYSSLGINNQAHALIIPFTHLPTIAAMAPDEREKTLAEMTKFRDSLQTMVGKQSSNKLGAVTYEISQGDGVHTHWQFIPMSGNDIRKGLVEMAFKVEAENRQYPEFEARDPGIGQGEGDFFRVWLWTPPSDEQPEGSTKCLTMPIDSNRRFYLQFGRVVLAKLLGLENRLQWRDCAQSDEEEKKEAEGFKAAFKEFDFTI